MKGAMALTAIVAGGLIGAGIHEAGAQGAMTDPTRPPSAAEATGGTATPAGPQLQSVLISPNRRLAVISGETVRQGATIGDARVVRITETEVTLKRGEETEVLKLTPGVDKKAGRVRKEAAREAGR
jgi:MSHA biogenesis protein MshK